MWAPVLHRDNLIRLGIYAFELVTHIVGCEQRVLAQLLCPQRPTAKFSLALVAPRPPMGIRLRPAPDRQVALKPVTMQIEVKRSPALSAVATYELGA
jgi:hypothetical protein